MSRRLNKKAFSTGATKLFKRITMSNPNAKKNKEDSNREVSDLDISKEAKTMIEKILGDVSKTSATKQIVIGTTSGWMTGFLTMKVGKMAAFAVGGGIIILQIAAHQGYIKINWDQIQKKADKIADKVEERVTGEGPKLLDKVGNWWRTNSFLGTSFVGGFIIGLAS
ncbi:FUN14 domain-containing protein 1 isoform X2 [Belonocnema kinseyi]|uniref:FUN14 domain-containing protein 1 isoform X2 n=1 Tax=Belonocnema kinseyi TaxID=2817044 RepID=UPI00143D7832|nr:FUN14 domain-containing protein 1 isoform X2 [Belonocnema kinseyi]